MSAMPIVLFGLSGLLVGGVWAMRQQGAGRGAIAIVAILAVLAAAGGVAWLIPGDS